MSCKFLMECIKKSLKRKNERISKLLKQIRVIKEEVSNLRKDAKKGFSFQGNTKKNHASLPLFQIEN